MNAAFVNATSETADAAAEVASHSGLEAVFRASYPRIARIINRVIQDPARAEELAVEVFLKLWGRRQTTADTPMPLVYRAAVHKGLDELRRRARREHYESNSPTPAPVLNPEELETARRQRAQVRAVLGVLQSRYAETLVLHGSGLAYDELATALNLNPASVGKLLSRAREAFRKEYIARYGTV